MQPAKTGAIQGRLPDGRFAPGRSGNPNGRPRGSRSTTANVRELVLEHALGQDDEGRIRAQHALDRIYREDPKAYLKACVSFLPRVDLAGVASQGTRITLREIVAVLERGHRQDAGGINTIEQVIPALPAGGGGRG